MPQRALGEVRNPRPVGSQLRLSYATSLRTLYVWTTLGGVQVRPDFSVKTSHCTANNPRNTTRIGSLFRLARARSAADQALALPVSAVRSLRSA